MCVCGRERRTTFTFTFHDHQVGSALPISLAIHVIAKQERTSRRDFVEKIAASKVLPNPRTKTAQHTLTNGVPTIRAPLPSRQQNTYSR